VVVREIPLKPACDGVQVRPGLRNRDPGLEPCDDTQKVCATIGPARVVAQSDRNGDLGVPEREHETSRYHADDGVTGSVQVDRATDDRAVSAETAIPPSHASGRQPCLLPLRRLVAATC